VLTAVMIPPGYDADQLPQDCRENITCLWGRASRSRTGKVFRIGISAKPIE